MMKKVTKAVIPAAGLGTRVLPATKAMPKGMLPIVDKPAIQYIVEEAVRSGITEIHLCVGRYGCNQKGYGRKNKAASIVWHQCELRTGL